MKEREKERCGSTRRKTQRPNFNDSVAKSWGRALNKGFAGTVRRCEGCEREWGEVE